MASSVLTWGDRWTSAAATARSPLAELIEVIRLAGELGYRGCYSADETYHMD